MPEGKEVQVNGGNAASVIESIIREGVEISM